MSLSRQLFREFRPLFRMLEEPFPAAFSNQLRHPFSNELGPNFRDSTRPAVDLVEDGNHYVVEAELPGVKKENLGVSVGNDGRSLTIEGKIFSRSVRTSEPSNPAADATTAPTAQAAEVSDATAEAVVSSNTTLNLPSSENAFESAQTFTRSIWLPRAVDGSNVTAKLEDGILTVRIPKANDQKSFKIDIE